MAKKATGRVIEAGGKFSTVLTMSGQKRKKFHLPTCSTIQSATERSKLLAEQITALRIAGQLETRTAQSLLGELAIAVKPGAILKVLCKLCGGELRESPEFKEDRGPTFKQVADRWISGDLHAEFRDQVPEIIHSDNKSRADWISAIVLNGVKLGDLPVSEWTVEHAEHAMRSLPPDVKRPATRRHYAQLMRRIFELAVYPMKLIAVNPIPRKLLPSVGKPPLYPYLRPAEDAALLGCTEIPLELRIAAGFACREGLRQDEQLSLDVGDFDFVDGAVTESAVGSVTLGENKTDDPRSWALSPDVAQAMRLMFRARKVKRSDPAFVTPDGERLTSARLAERLRAALLIAGVDRPALHEAGVNTGVLRWHDLRGSFVTVSLATGKSETWVADRTGHKSTLMIQRYRKRSREASELGLGTWLPLTEAIPELRELIRNGNRNGSGSEGGNHGGSESENPSDSGEVAPPGVEPGHSFELRILNQTQARLATGGSENSDEIDTTETDPEGVVANALRINGGDPGGHSDVDSLVERVALGCQAARQGMSAALKVGPWRVSSGYRVRDVKGTDGKWRTSLEHREVMSRLLGRPLSKSEHVHHKDENRLNNEPSNLELLTHAEHTRRHFRTGRAVSERVCQGCGTSFSRDAKYKAARFCGRVCASKYAGKRSGERRSGRAA